MRSLAVRTALVALLLAVSACSGSSDEPSAEPASPARTSSTPAKTPTTAPTSTSPSVAPVDLPPCQSIGYDVRPNQAGSRTPVAAVRSWGKPQPKDVPPVPVDGWEPLPADSESAVTLTNPTAPVWMVEATRTDAGGWVVTRVSWGVCH